MKPLVVLLLCLLWAANACGGPSGGLTQAELAGVAASPPPGARLDLGLAARDTAGVMHSIGSILDGRPAFFTFVDYTCTTLCGTSMALLGEALAHSKLAASDYRIVVMGLDLKASPQAADAMAAHEIPDPVRQATFVLLPDRDTLAHATAMLGFHYAYDTVDHRFAHPAAVYVIAPDGAVRGVLSPFALTAGDIETALDSRPRTGLFDRVRLLCYGLDPLHGVYNARVGKILRIAAALTVVLLASAVMVLPLAGKRVR